MLDEGNGQLNQTWLSVKEKKAFYINKTKEKIRLIVSGIDSSFLRRGEKLELLEQIKKQIDEQAFDTIRKNV